MNALLHNSYRQTAEKVYCYDPAYGEVGAQTLEKLSLKVGDLVLYTQNDYKLGLRNGSLGVIVKALKATGPESHCCICKFGGSEYVLKTPQIYALKHAYSITVHKSQGSQPRLGAYPCVCSALLQSVRPGTFADEVCLEP